MNFEPAYYALWRAGQLRKRVEDAKRHLSSCDLCADHCRVNRHETAVGTVCHTGATALVSSYGAHHGEELPLRGWKGSGTIFFSWCNLRCVYCQNWEISQKGLGREVSPDEIASMMVQLQQQDCHNINLVSPSHVLAPILAAIEIAVQNGLRLPLVYNTGGYDSLEALELLDGIIDIYMPDMKYGDSDAARRYSKIQDYVEVNQKAVKRMHQQVGDLVVDKDGIALRGLLIRHLVLPGDLSGTSRVLAFIAEEISTQTYLM
jgi:putative pyruvate formate lyase activating enzyme